MIANTPSPAGDRLGIAEQVIVSAGNILVAAGFGREDIARFFRQAADQIDGGQIDGAQQGAPAAPQGPAQAMLAAYRAIAPVRTIARLLAEAGALAHPQSGPVALRDGYDLAMRLIPQIAEAQGWLRDTAREAGLVLATDDHPQPGGAPGEALRLEEFHFAYDAGFALIAAVAETLAGQQDEQALRLILMSLVDNNIAVSRELKTAMERAIARLA